MHEQLRRPALYVVATPIGNLADVTLRAAEVLRGVDRVAAEDTRVTSRLLAHLGVEKPMLALHQHNERRTVPRVLGALAAGEAIALAADAGTPGLSDPGAVLVAAAREAGYAVVPIPGPSALAAAWSVSGFAGPFLFQGFLPPRAAERRKLLAALASLEAALVFYEAPHRVVETARDLAEVLAPARRVVVARELTKLFESIHACTLGELPAWLDADANRSRGELVLMVGPPLASAADTALGETALRVLVEELAPAQAARLAARISGASRATLYDLAMSMKSRSGRDA